MSCTAATVCTAVGSYANSSGLVAMAERWNGSSWKIQPTPTGARPGFLSGVSCTAATACTAVGDYDSSGMDVTLAERWNGSTWKIQPTPNPAGGTYSSLPLLNGVSCTAPTACTAVGYYVSSGGTHLTLAERYS